MKKKKVIISILICVILIVPIIFGIANGNFNSKAKAARTAYATEVARIEKEEAELINLAKKIDELTDSGVEPYEPEKRLACNSQKVEALRDIYEIPKRPILTSKTNELVKELKTISYEERINSLEAAYLDYAYSVKQGQQITNPSKELVIELTKDIEGIIEYAAVTEDNDPNGQLNKPGGYNAAIFYRYDKVPEDYLFGDDPIDIGTVGGMCIEVYQNVDDANKRNDYLAKFDGGVLASGHYVLGTMVVRISNELTASEQSYLSNLVTCALTYVE